MKYEPFESAREDPKEKAAYHFVAWLFHAGGRRILDAIKNQREKKEKEVKMAYQSERLFSDVVDGKVLNPSEATPRFAAQAIDLLAGDDDVVWFTFDPSFGFDASFKEPWSFGFIYDYEVLIKEYGGRIREVDFIHDYGEILEGVLTKHIESREWLPTELRAKCHYLCNALKSLPSAEQEFCRNAFREEARLFRARNELCGDAALAFLASEAKRPHELVVSESLPCCEAKAIVWAGEIRQQRVRDT